MTSPTLNLSVSRTFKARPETVFRAFTDPDWYARWWGPEGSQCRNVRVDLREGGSYSLDMHLPDGSIARMYGTYREIVPPERLVYTWTWEGENVETLVTLELEAVEGGTELTMTQEGFRDSRAVAMHDHGWSGSLDRLEGLLPELAE